MKRLSQILFVLLTFSTFITAERELKQVITLIRHGARLPAIGPIKKYLLDQSLPGTDAQLRAQLTGNGL